MKIEEDNQERSQLGPYSHHQEVSDPNPILVQSLGILGVVP